VYAVEATDVCKHTRALVAANGVQDVVKVIHGRMEDVSLPEKVNPVLASRLKPPRDIFSNTRLREVPIGGYSISPFIYDGR
jgi:hypothetical protein